MPRFSLKTLLIAAAVVPLAAYGLVRATPFIESIVITIAVLTWLAGVVVSLECEGEFRAVARSFVVTSLAFAIFTWGGNANNNGNQRLLTDQLLSRVHGLVVVETEVPVSFGFGISAVGVKQLPSLEQFLAVGQIYWCAIVGLAGGWLAGWFYRRQKANQSSTEASTDP